MFPHSRSYLQPPGSLEASWFDSATNPFAFDLAGWRFLGTGGQTVSDIAKYASTPGSVSSIEIMEAMLRWRLTAPTAPDTLWCYPFQDGDAFVVKECPHVYFAGNQGRFESEVIEGPQGQMSRLVSVPAFKETGEVVVLDLETLGVEIVKFEV